MMKKEKTVYMKDKEFDMDRERGWYFQESHNVSIGSWYTIHIPPICLDGVFVGTKRETRHPMVKHIGHIVQVIGYHLPLRTDHFGNADIYCKKCKKQVRSISTQFLREIMKDVEIRINGKKIYEGQIPERQWYEEDLFYMVNELIDYYVKQDKWESKEEKQD